MARSDELLDVVTVTGLPVGVRPRSEVHAEGLWHQTFHCLVVRSTAPATIVLQRRHLQARAFPGKLDLSATGHLQAGETPLDGIRELHEELGIEASTDDLIPLGVRLLVDDSGEGHNRERTHAFLLVDDRPLEAFRPDPAEVTGLVELAVDDLLNLLAAPGRATAPALEWMPGTAPADVIITAEDLVKPVDGYWTVLAVMAKRWVYGERPLAV